MSADKHNSPTENKKNSVTETTPTVSKTKQDADVVTANTSSPLNPVLWILALLSFISATLVNQYLPAYWQPASSVWVRIGIIVGLIVFGILCFFLTAQGKGFSNLMSDSQTELRRVTWPTREETFKYTWKTLLVMLITGILIWVLDGLSNLFVSNIIKLFS